jgi:hypothetical protein
MSHNLQVHKLILLGLNVMLIACLCTLSGQTPIQSLVLRLKPHLLCRVVFRDLRRMLATGVIYLKKYIGSRQMGMFFSVNVMKLFSLSSTNLEGEPS